MCMHDAAQAAAGLPALAGPRKKADFVSAAPRSSRRRRVWELEARSHCPVIGICFSLQDVRALLRRAAPELSDAGDFAVHATVVQACARRNPLSERVQRALEQRHAAQLRQWQGLRGRAAVAAAWRTALAGGQVAGALWVTLTHPDCDAGLADQVYEDVHMLQHQLGAGERGDQQDRLRLQQENLLLARELARLQREVSASRDAQVRRQQALREELARVRSQCVGHEAAAARYYAELGALREQAATATQNVALVRRCRTAESRNRALTARLAEQEQALERTRARLARLETPLAGTTPDAAAVSAVELGGCHVLCVGGRTGCASVYRRLVEEQGGRFSFHDGGVEESLGRLEAAVAAADAVICQAGCISHNAYWRVKEHCKRTGKRCAFLRNPSVSAFLDGLDAIGDNAAGRGVPEGSA